MDTIRGNPMFLSRLVGYVWHMLILVFIVTRSYYWRDYINLSPIHNQLLCYDVQQVRGTVCH